MSLSKPKSNGSDDGSLSSSSSPGSDSTAAGFAARRHSKAPFHVLSHVRYEHLIAGISGGIASTLVLHPLDLLKVRFAGELI